MARSSHRRLHCYCSPYIPTARYCTIHEPCSHTQRPKYIVLPRTHRANMNTPHYFANKLPFPTFLLLQRFPSNPQSIISAFPLKLTHLLLYYHHRCKSRSSKTSYERQYGGLLVEHQFITTNGLGAVIGEGGRYIYIYISSRLSQCLLQ